MNDLDLRKYIGTKTVQACPMSRKSAEEMIGRKMRPDSDEIENEAGYLVVYPDGYKSWSPETVFKQAYNSADTYVDRMIIEHKEVKERYLNGRDFSFSQEYRKLSEEERTLLRKQLDQMESYLYTLTRRIELAKIQQEMREPTDLCCGTQEG